MIKITTTEIAKEKRNQYHREWRAKNKDKVKRYNSNYWENKVKKELEVKQNERTTKIYDN